MNEEFNSLEKRKKVLLVEGNDDANVCYHLFKCFQLEKYITSRDKEEIDKITLRDKEGVDKILKTLPAEIKRSGLSNIGVIVDADEDIMARWQALRAILIRAGYKNVPVEPDANGTIIKQDEMPIMGVWIMPDNLLPGMIEHFCSFLIPSEDLLWTMAKETVQQVIQIDRRFPEAHIMKAYMHTWLAWQGVPGRPMGQAISKQFLNHKAPYAQVFMQWIQQLFDVTSIESEKEVAI